MTNYVLSHGCCHGDVPANYFDHVTDNLVGNGIIIFGSGDHIVALVLTGPLAMIEDNGIRVMNRSLSSSWPAAESTQ